MSFVCKYTDIFIVVCQIHKHTHAHTSIRLEFNIKHLSNWQIRASTEFPLENLSVTNWRLSRISLIRSYKLSIEHSNSTQVKPMLKLRICLCVYIYLYIYYVFDMWVNWVCYGASQCVCKCDPDSLAIQQTTAPYTLFYVCEFSTKSGKRSRKIPVEIHLISEHCASGEKKCGSSWKMS